MTQPPDPGQAPVEPRPQRLDPQELGFTPQSPVAWLAPIQLAGTATRVVLSQWFGAYLDKRELQNTLPDTVFDEGADEPEAWIDFVADLGDGFDPTYSIAYLLAQPTLTVDGHETRRGRMLMMGGDEVYPVASTQRYEDRTKGPYRAALPVCPPGEDGPRLYALPGNHDWYDGLTAFTRMFARAGNGTIGAWRNEQARSYFAIQLPQRWWVFAIDTQFGVYIDDPQLRYFREAAARLGPGDRVIVCPPTPGWVESQQEPGAYDAIDYFVRTVIEPTGADVSLMLSGDLHHYAHYEGAERHLVHCGGGGAYLYATHKLPETIQVPPPASLVRKASPTKEYRLRGEFPSKARSRRYAMGVFGRVPSRNPSFGVLLGLLHTMFMLGVVDIVRHVRGTEQHLVTIPVAIVGLLMLGGTTFFAMPPTAGRRRARHWLFGIGHGVVHIGLGVAGAEAWAHLPAVGWSWPLPLMAAFVVYLPVSGLVAIEVVSAYLLLAGSVDVNLNELFAGQGITDSKSFLRLHIAPDGSLTIYPVAVDRVCRKWTMNPDGAPDESWIRPAEPLPVRLAEQPIRLGASVAEPA